MTKIDETKNYRFSEIVKMLEDNELPAGTTIMIGEDPAKTITLTVSGKHRINHTDWLFAMVNLEHAITSVCTIKLTTFEETMYYLEAPKRFAKGNSFLNYDRQTKAYFLGGQRDSKDYQTKFTQLEIGNMPFDTDFFGEPIEVTEWNKS